MNELKLEPLESAFGGRSDLAAVKVEGDIKQGLCAEFKIHVPVIASPVVKRVEGNNIEVNILFYFYFIQILIIYLLTFRQTMSYGNPLRTQSW